jgi:hypothetical protein
VWKGVLAMSKKAMKPMTIDDIYMAINPLPAALSAKGKIKPDVWLNLHANANVDIVMSWDKRHTRYSYDRDYKTFTGGDFQSAIDKAVTFIKELPSAEQAKLHEFMAKLGNLIDAGKSDGIDLDYMNPLLDTMKRLSENVITFQPGTKP